MIFTHKFSDKSAKVNYIFFNDKAEVLSLVKNHQTMYQTTKVGNFSTASSFVIIKRENETKLSTAPRPIASKFVNIRPTLEKKGAILTDIFGSQKRTINCKTSDLLIQSLHPQSVHINRSKQVLYILTKT